MKWLTCVLLLISYKCNAQESVSQDRMQQKTLEAVAKFYKLDIIGQETFRRVQERYLPEELKPYIPYFGTMVILVREQKFVYRSSF